MEKQLIDYIKKLSKLKKEFENSQGQNKQDALNLLLGFIDGGEQSIKLLTTLAKVRK